VRNSQNKTDEHQHYTDTETAINLGTMFSCVQHKGLIFLVGNSS
jgi:hypothetical protein